MAKLQRKRSIDGVYVDPQNGYILVLENVWLEQFFDFNINELILLHTATVEGRFIPRTKNVTFPELEKLIKIGNL